MYPSIPTFFSSSFFFFFLFSIIRETLSLIYAANYFSCSPPAVSAQSGEMGNSCPRIPFPREVLSPMCKSQNQRGILGPKPDTPLRISQNISSPISPWADASRVLRLSVPWRDITVPAELFYSPRSNLQFFFTSPWQQYYDDRRELSRSHD